MEQTVHPTAEPVTAPVSEFKGRTIQLIGWRLLGTLISVVTLGICMPWAHCMVMRWETNHTYINGQQLHFDGKGGQLFGRYLLWGLLTIVTIGIYGLFVPVKRRQWRASHTRLATEAEKKPETAPAAASEATPTPEAPSGDSKGGIIVGFIIAGVLLLTLCGLLVLKAFTAHDPTSLNQGLLQYLYNKPAQHHAPSSKPGDFLGDLEDGFHFGDLEDGFHVGDQEDGNFYFGDGEGNFEGTMQVIQNEDGSFTIIYGDESVNSGDMVVTPVPSNDIVGQWMRHSENPLGFSVTTYTFHTDGTFTTFSDTFGFGSGRGWQASGLSDQNGGGSYRYEDGQLYLYDIYYKIPPNETESGEWELRYTDATHQWEVTSDDNGETVIPGYIRVTGSVGEMLDQLYPDGPPHDTI